MFGSRSPMDSGGVVAGNCNRKCPNLGVCPGLTQRRGHLAPASPLCLPIQGPLPRTCVHYLFKPPIPILQRSLKSMTWAWCQPRQGTSVPSRTIALACDFLVHFHNPPARTLREIRAYPQSHGPEVAKLEFKPAKLYLQIPWAL